MSKIKDLTKQILALVTDDPDTLLQGAFNIREDSGLAGRKSTDNIQIVGKEGEPGIDIHIKAGTKGESVFIPACITKSDVDDLVYNDFYIGEDADVTIVAGCGVHTEGSGSSQHNGIHRFFVGKNAKAKYLEKHVGFGEGTGQRTINPVTEVLMEEGSYLEIDTSQIEGVDSSDRETFAKLEAGAKLIVNEKLMTHDDQIVTTDFVVDLNGEDSATDIISKSVAKGTSKQYFKSIINGNTKSKGHSACDAIIMDQGIVTATPELTANSVDTELIHEAAIGKIAGEQLIKLMTLGLDEEEAEATIIEGFLS